MTKTLTEQWKDMELEHGLYYVRSNYNNIFVGLPYGINMMRVIDNGCFDVDSIKEVLAPVPSYEEWKRLQEQLNEANEVIRYYDIKEPKYVEDGVVVAKDPAHRYLEKWGVK